MHLLLIIQKTTYVRIVYLSFHALPFHRNNIGLLDYTKNKRFRRQFRI